LDFTDSTISQQNQVVFSKRCFHQKAQSTEHVGKCFLEGESQHQPQHPGTKQDGTDIYAPHGQDDQSGYGNNQQGTKQVEHRDEDIIHLAFGAHCPPVAIINNYIPQNPSQDVGKDQHQQGIADPFNSNDCLVSERDQSQGCVGTIQEDEQDDGAPQDAQEDIFQVTGKGACDQFQQPHQQQVDQERNDQPGSQVD